MPPILSTSHCEFNDTRLCTHTQKTILLTQLHPLSTQIIPSLYPQTFPSSSCRSLPSVFCCGHYKGLPSMNNIFTRTSFFSCLFLSFHRTLFVGACVNPEVFLELLLTCLSNYSLISSWISAKLGSALPPCMLYLSYCSLKNTLECVCERLLHCRLIFS